MAILGVKTPPGGGVRPPRGGSGGVPPQKGVFSCYVGTKMGQKHEKSGNFEKFPGGGSGNPQILVGNPISKLPESYKNTPPRGGGWVGGGYPPPKGGFWLKNRQKQLKTAKNSQFLFKIGTNLNKILDIHVIEDFIKALQCATLIC